MKITWSVPVRGERLGSSRGDLVRAQYLIEALQADGHDVRVVEDGLSFTVRAYRGVVQPRLPRRVALMLRDMGRWVQGYRHGRRVAAAAREQRADVIIETQVHFAASGAWASRITGLPLVLDDCSPSSEEGVLGVGLPGLARHVLKQQTKAASTVIAVSWAMCAALRAEGMPAGKLRVVPNGVNIAAYEGVDRQAARERLGLGDQCVFGFIGSFQPWHEVELLIEAFARLVDDYRVHLVLVGDGPGRESALAASHRLGVSDRVTAVGAVPPSDVPELVCAFDVGVLPGSNDYGHPMKLTEYAAGGVASVAADLPPVHEVLQDGLTGLLFPPGNVDALAAALRQLAVDDQLRGRLGACARGRVAYGTAWTDRARALAAYAASNGWREEVRTSI